MLRMLAHYRRVLSIRLLHPPRRKSQWFYLFLVICCVYITCDTFGAFTHIREKDFYTEFSYPYEGDIQTAVMQLRMNTTPDIPPINYYNYTYLSELRSKCSNTEAIRLVYLIKSAAKNRKTRDAIRKTWGYEKRFSDVEIRTIFFIGKTNDAEINKEVIVESIRHSDIVLIDFMDSYFNNTIKTMMSFKWAASYCSNAKFYMFVDDDYYVSTRNVLRFIRNPTNYPEYVKPFLKQARNVLDIEDFELDSEVRMYSGFVFHTAPHRHKVGKWFVTLEEYPFHLWPPYASAGAYVLSKEALMDLYYTSFYTKHFRFDDVYVGLLAYKAHIEPFHSDEFCFYKNKAGFQFTIASHGYEDPEELISTWNLQRGLGNA